MANLNQMTYEVIYLISFLLTFNLNLEVAEPAVRRIAQCCKLS